MAALKSVPLRDGGYNLLECHMIQHELYPVIKACMEFWPAPTGWMPTLRKMSAMMRGDVRCRSTDGCEVDQKGYCEHGHPSWLVRIGAIV